MAPLGQRVRCLVARAVEMTVDAATVRLMPTGQARPRFEYENGARTDRPVTHDDGRPVYALDAVVELAGQALGSVRVETCTTDLPESVPLGTVWTGQGQGQVRIRPDSQYEVAVTVRVPDIQTQAARPARTGGEG